MANARARGRGRALLEATLRELDETSPLVARGLSIGALSPLSMGAAGVAYFFHRLGREAKSARLLSLAALWIDRAKRDLVRPEAFRSPEGEIDPSAVGDASLQFGPLGVHCVDALVSLARGDEASVGPAVRAFLASARGRVEGLDATIGSASTLIGAAAILDLAPAEEHRAALLAYGDATLAALWSALDAMPPIAECTEIELPGAAHGWAGFLFATLRWAESTGRKLPARTLERLQELAEEGTMSDVGTIRWPYRSRATPDNDGGSWVGWCNGSAGYALLWTLARDVTKDDDYLVLAEGAALHARMTNGIRQLCCGAGGQAYAALAVHRATGDARWLKEARALASYASAKRHKVLVRPGLYKGDVGVALLEAELANPRTARMPLFEREPTKPGRNAVKRA